MEKVSLKLVILYIFMTYMAIMIIRGRLLSRYSIGKEPEQPKEVVAESKKPETQAEEKKDLGKDSDLKNTNEKEKNKSNTNEQGAEDISGKFPDTIAPALKSLKNHLSTPAHLFEGTTN